MQTIRVVVCDDQESIVSYLRSLIDEQPDLEVVGVAGNSADGVRITAETHPDIVLMDIQMESERAGIHAIEQISEQFPDIKIIVITIHKSDELILDAYLAGAVDYLVKMSDSDSICEGIRKSYHNDSYIGPLITHRMRHELKNMRDKKKSLLFVINEISKLTPAELDVLRLLYLGNTQKEVAKIKFLEISTIKFHVNNILKKLQFTSIKELKRALKEFGVFEDSELSLFNKS